VQFIVVMTGSLFDGPPLDVMVCLQDVHWSAGLFGYFPTYRCEPALMAHWVPDDNSAEND
jgi:Zn-dependent M32 family carboxypeptidase